MSCPSSNCNGKLVEDDSQMLTHIVCCECGLLVETCDQFREAEFNIGNIASVNPSSTLSKNDANIRYSNESFKEGLSKINMLTSHCHVPQHIKIEAIDLFEKVHKTNQLKYLHAEQKSVLAAGCFYTAVRKHNIMLTISYISNLISVPHSKISSAFNMLKQQFCIDVLTPGPEQMIETFMGNMLEAKELNTKEMRNRMEKIMLLSKECLFTTGLSFQHLLLAVLYVSWGSLEVRKQKLMSFTVFAKYHKISRLVNPTTSKRVRELLQMLCDLANNIPSLKSSKIDKKNIFWYVETVLEFQNLSMKCAEQDEEEQGLRTYTFLREPVKRKREECDENEREEKTFQTNRDLNDPNLTDKDIPEAEIHKYLKTKDEVKRLKELLEK